MSDTDSKHGGENNHIIERIIEVQREFYFENKNKDSERRRRLKSIIEQATPLKDN